MAKLLKLTLTIDPEEETVSSTLHEGKDTECPKCKHIFEDIEEEEDEEKEKRNDT